jgi:hypothetical protein
MDKLFTLIDPKTNEPVCGLANQPANNGNFMIGGLSSIGGEKHWHNLDLDESVPVQDKRGEVYRMIRVQ